MSDTLPFQLDVGFDRLYGLRVTEMGDGSMRGTVPVRDAIKQPAGLVHGGIYAAVAESLATTGTALAVIGNGDTAVGLSNQTSFLRPVTEGAVHAVARARHRGRTTWVWEVECTDDSDRLCALSRITVAVRPAPPGTPEPSGSAVGVEGA
jgi:1,4-dihydroxy-2-naphthoyl-CoA hydrolase